MRCDEKGITLNWEKRLYTWGEVQFTGFILSKDRYQVDSSITDAITKFPSPSTRSDLCSFVGLVNQLSASTATITTLLNPLRPLLSTKNEFLWTPEIDLAFTKVKESPASASMLSNFDLHPTPHHCPQAGFLLFQNTCSDQGPLFASKNFSTEWGFRQLQPTSRVIGR